MGRREVRRVRLDQGDKGARLELMRRRLRQTDACLTVSGGACHEWHGTPGVASAFLQARCSCA